MTRRAASRAARCGASRLPARCCTEPPLLLLDEATVGLDVQSRAGILANIRRLVETEGISVFWATHLIDEVGRRATRSWCSTEGKLVANGRSHDVVKATGAKTIGEAFSRA